jgi:uncharacterized protein (TIGR02687 family)
MASKISEKIKQLLAQEKVVFWYDAKREFERTFASLELEDVKKIKVEGNEWKIKCEIWKSSPQQKYLLYLDYDPPPPEENWLLDLELAGGVINASPAHLYLYETELPASFLNWIEAHLAFFQAKERLENFRRRLQEWISQAPDPSDILTEKNLNLILLQYVFNADFAQTEAFLKEYLVRFLKGKDQSLQEQLKKYNLEEFFWSQVRQTYHYANQPPGIFDFALELFKAGFGPLAPSSPIRGARVLFAYLKEAASFQESLRELAKKVEESLGRLITDAIEELPFDRLLEEDLFESVEQKIIELLAQGLAQKTILPEQAQVAIRKRENKFWYKRYENFYQSLKFAAAFLELVPNYTFAYASAEDGIKKYRENEYKIDTYYRKFVFYLRRTSNNPLLASLSQVVENFYTRSLRRQAAAWQEHVPPLLQKRNYYAQARFFEREVRNFLERGVKLFVIFSDALRYECAAELFELLQKENRFSCELSYQIACLPSYTQLGMAAMLPHQTLAWQPPTDTVYVDQMSSQGKNQRQKILETWANGRFIPYVFDAEELMKMDVKTLGREVSKKGQLFYIYHNGIDTAGDSPASEETIFEAVKRELRFLMDLIRKIYNMNGYHILITADHGFLYARAPLEAPEQLQYTPTEREEVWKLHRRFVIGKNLSLPSQDWEIFDAPALGLSNEASALLPKGLQRIRMSGGTSRFVHGGATLQEIVLPILRIYVKRQDTHRMVEIEVVNSQNNRITAASWKIEFFQKDPVGKAIRPRAIVAAFYAPAKRVVISDSFSYRFESESLNVPERIVAHSFTFTPAAVREYKGQKISLEIYEVIEGSHQTAPYKSYPYILNISFADDFFI